MVTTGKKMYVYLCAVSPVASCSHGQMVRLTVCEVRRPEFESRSMFFFFFSLLDICAAELATWGVGPDVYTPSNGKMCPRNVM